MIYKIIFFYLLLVNLWGFFIMGFDKKRAIKQKSRVSEALLWQIACIGGAFGMYIGMKYYRHKTKHTSFVWGIPAVILIQISVLYLLSQFLTD